MGTRVLAAVAVLVSAGVHLYLWNDGYKDLDKIGPAFLLNAVGGVVIAVLLLAWSHWVPAFLALGFGLSTLGAFIISTTVGLFGLQESWEGWYVWVAAVSEVAAIVLGAMLLLRNNPLRSSGQSQQHAGVRRPGSH
ncbi:hypothetical protein [Nocardioides sp.]|uniref:hypothetical protein n=1 Tax=Nocardioides sp. TaxID=35761 RepID=UPI002ED4444C